MQLVTAEYFQSMIMTSAILRFSIRREAYCTGDRILSANYNDIRNTENLHQKSSTVQLVTVNDNHIGNSEILHQESSRSTNSAAEYLPPIIMIITLTMTKYLTIIMAQKIQCRQYLLRSSNRKHCFRNYC